MSNVRILAIAPYEGMKLLLHKSAKEYDSIELTVFVGDLKKGLEIAQRNFHENYDVIVSRGGTAELIQKSVSLPVIEINTSAYDILRTLKLSGADKEKVAIVGFAKITEQSLILKELLPYPLDVYTINSTDEALRVLQCLKNEEYHAVLCDMITYTTARSLSMEAYLITSGIESIRKALDEAIQHFRNYRQLGNENQFFRQLIKVRDMRTLVFNNEGKLLFSTITDENFPLLDELHDEIYHIKKDKKKHLLYRHNNQIYSVQAQLFFNNESEYISFFITTSKAPLSENKCGIKYFNQKKVESDSFDSIYNALNFFGPLNTTIDKANQNLSPVIINGEEGTGKEQVAKAIYLHSCINNHPFILIDCGLLNDKVWDYLLNHHNSPLCGSENTIYIKNINLLTLDKQRQIWVTIVDMDIHKRNRLIISFISNAQYIIHSNFMAFINELNFFVITLPALRDDLPRFNSIVKLYLNRLNIHNENHILGFTEGALQIMGDYYWPYNFMQLSRVMNNLVINSNGAYIDEDNVKKALSIEITIAPASFNNSVKLLDLSHPLSKINKEIALLILEANGDNHTKAAKSLGISRTTLWRLLNT